MVWQHTSVAIAYATRRVSKRGALIKSERDSRVSLDMEDTSTQTPLNVESGQHVMLPIVQSATRVTYLPEPFILSATDSFVEIILLRFEGVPFAHSGTTGVDEGGRSKIDLSPGRVEMANQLTDLAHVRLSNDQARALADALVAHAERLKAGSSSIDLTRGGSEAP